MKNITKMLLSIALLGLCSGAYAEDRYAQLSRELSEAGAELHGKKIAIIPFSYADSKDKASKDGSVIAERLTIKLINAHKFEIIERSVLDKVMAELKLQASGVIDASSAQQLGKVLGVEAIITGTLVEMQGGQIEVNARLIKTETAQAIGASQVSLKKDWIGDASAARQQEQVYQESRPAPAPRRKARGRYAYNYIDLFMGFGSPNMKLEFSNPKGNIMLDNTYTNHLGVRLVGAVGSQYYKSVTWDKLKTEGFGPLVMRIGGYGDKNIGGALEMGLERRNIAPQDTTWSLNNGSPGSFTFSSNDYLTLTSFYLAGELMVRLTKKTKAEPYLGVGLGLSLNGINMPRVKGYTKSSAFSAPTEEFAVGVVFNVPLGVRVQIGEKTQLVAEIRAQMNTMKFDRDINSESDTLTTSGAYFNLGLGFDF